MCTPKIPEIPAQAQRQATKTPDGGLADPTGANDNRRRRSLMAGLITNAFGLGAPNVAKPTLG